MTWRNGLAVVFGDDRLEKIPLRLVSICLLIAALGFAWMPHRQSYLMFWQTWISFTPDFMSGALALAIIAPLYARRIIPYPYHSLNNALFFIVNLALMATFIQITLGKGTTLGTLPSLTVIICAIALSWLGMRAAASLAWLVLLVFSVFSAIISNDVWGVQGFGFVAAGFSGILLQTPLNPAGLFAEILNEYGGGSPAPPVQNIENRSHLIEY
jgi:hypothetical protein